MIANTLMDAARIAARCSACGRKPEQITTRTRMETCEIEIVVYCHGSTEVIAVGRHELTIGNLDHCLRRLGDLFPHDATPDMIELLKYNRNPWRT